MISMKKMMFYLILAILLFAIYGAANLSIIDFQKQNVCPKLLSIPACYIVLVCFILVLIAHLWTSSARSSLFYYSILSVPFLMALQGTITELSGTVICPRTSGGTPMCYLSLALCFTLLILKIIESRIL